MNKFLLFIAYGFLALYGCKDQPKSDNSSNVKIVHDFVKTYEGRIGDKYDIMMKLSSDSGQVTGFYFYKNQGIDIKVAGQIDSEGQFSLNEYDKGGNATGLFKGRISGARLEGTWSKPNGDKSSNFSVVESNTLYESAKRESAAEKYSNITGTYQPSQVDGTSAGELVIKYLGNNQFQFSLSVVGFSECTGEVSGIAKIVDGIGNYTGENCELLSFKFKDSRVSISETACQLHGARCSFDGEYVKE